MRVCPVLVGRSAELDALERARAAGGGLVLVEGEAGIGKSRLLREFAERAARAGAAVAWGRPEAVSRPGPYSVIMDLLEDVGPRLTRGEAEARELAESLGTFTEGGAEPPSRPIAARTRGILGLLGAGRVVMIEDLHQADELSQSVVAHLARSAREDGTLLVATYRPEESNAGLSRLLDLLTRDRIATTISLGPLTEDALIDMLEAMWRARPADDELAAIAKLGEGIPFYIEELAAAHGEADRRVPESISRAVLTRLQPLGDQGKAVMRASSLMTGPIDVAVLADVCGLQQSAAPAILVEAVNAGLLVDEPTRLAFRHALVREAIANSIVSVERVELHARLAAAIERLYHDELDAHAQALARHHAESGNAGLAASFGLTAARRALAAGALEEARALFESVRDLDAGGTADLDAMVGLAEVWMRTRRLPEAVELLRRAADGYVAAGFAVEAARALSRAAWLKLSEGERGALSLLDEARSLLAGREDDPVYVRATIEKGRAHAIVFQEPDAGDALLAEGSERANRLGDPRLKAEAAEGFAWVAELRGDLARSDEFGAEACRLALSPGDDDLIANLHCNHALRLTMHGRCDEALSRLDEARGRLTGGLATLNLQSVDRLRAWVLWRMGSPAEAGRVASSLEATKWAREYAGVVRAWAATEAGEVARSAALVGAWWAELGDEQHRARSIARPDDIPGGGMAEVYAILAEVIVRIQGPGPVDEETLEMVRSYDAFCRTAVPDVRLLVALLHARALVRAGSLEDAEVVARDVDGWLRSAPYPLHEATALEVRGMIARARGSHVEALGAFDDAAGILARCPNHSDRARCERQAAEALIAVGADRDEIVARLRSAREVALSVGALVEANRIESAMRSMGIRPRAGRPKGPRRASGTLSVREREVAALVAAGASNAEIAARLFISERTVQDHIANGQRRLRVVGRAGLAAWAAKQGLV